MAAILLGLALPVNTHNLLRPYTPYTPAE
jgi:hypothetical protein